MRQNQQKQRPRGRSRKNPNPMSRSFESNGPDVKIRGNPAHIAERYATLARDASSSGDRVMAENYYQHAEHYNRIIAAAQSVPLQRSDEMGSASVGEGPQPDVSEAPAPETTVRQDANGAAKPLSNGSAEGNGTQAGPRRLRNRRRPRPEDQGSEDSAADSGGTDDTITKDAAGLPDTITRPAKVTEAEEAPSAAED